MTDLREAPRAEWDSTQDELVGSLVTLQMSWGGMFHGKPVEGIHLVRCWTAGGTPGPTLCGIDRFDKAGPGWSVGGGCTDPNAVACAGCVTVREASYPDRKVSDSMFAHLFPTAATP